MLTLQPKISNNYGPAFSSRRQERKLSPEEIEEREYYKARQELLNQKEELEELTQNDEIKMPEIAKKAIKGGAVVTTGLLGGMATGWGTKKTIQIFAKLAKSAPMQNIKTHIKDVNSFVKTTFKNIKTSFKKSEVYTIPANAIKKKYNKFGKTKVGAPITSFLTSVKNGISKVYNAIKGGLTKVYNKIKGTKKETYEKAAVNFVGASGGVASGVTALKEQDETAGEE